MDFGQTLVLGIFTGLIGFYLGRIKEFRETKHKVYASILPQIIESHFNKRDNEFNKSIILSWLYSNKKVAKKLDHIASIMVEPSRGNIIDEFQNLIVEMRNDIQPFTFKKLKAKDVKHIYMIFKKESSS